MTDSLPSPKTSAVPRRIRDDALARGWALLIARLVIALYLVELLLNITRPHLLPDEPAVSIFYELPKSISQQMNRGPFGSLDRLLSMPRMVFWAVMAGIVVGALLQVFAMITRPAGRRAVVLTWATLVALLGPFALMGLAVLATYPLTALACVPSTAFVLWLLHHGQRFARLPLSVLLTAFGWGAFIVFGLGRAYSGLAFATVYGYLLKDPGSPADLTAPLQGLYRVIDFLILHLSVVNVLLVAAGVVMILLLFRHRVTDTVTGLVLGAAVGLGYTFVESVLFIRLYGAMSSFTGATGGFEYWIRQSIGLLGGQVACGALLGAGLGLAAQTRQRRRRALIAGAALVAAVGGAVATEILSAWLSHLVGDHIEVGSAFDTLVVSPLLWLLPQAPFIVLAVLLLMTGRRARALAAQVALSAEAAEGGAITPGEAPFLTNPALRFWALAGTWRWYGRNAALALLRLQSAQLDLAGWRLQQQAAPVDNAAGVADAGDVADADDMVDAADVASREKGEQLRAKVMRLKANARSAVTS
ncbi:MULTISPECIES: PrsW family glutamic-type intramembrane protease [unclassified Streptomyces]|uniref:PrsW family glutamic-type intramembrane protease n=1 Tax=unclassified Streptomyces TaxID=2593676 RepID=UPI001BE67CE7|nr:MULTISPECIES: PrsW family glutamic-type intramembrane protease [unclassified Streptomyces]MBT2408516.1 PrsW family intramembrane metalloprotease [Streptomyces sp. ISL-21]MBT2459683.1 PrsW family intramembrane metalloprotease [Streptomyces sp. ISL-86]MBT2611953.1 PrsW family intramembrane metalloprotease [Streptomyces sp. ISL-87]